MIQHPQGLEWQAIEQIIISELKPLVLWAAERFGVMLQLEENALGEFSMGYHLHDQHGACHANQTESGFSSIAEALIDGIMTVVDRDLQDACHDYYALHAGLEAAGLSVFPSLVEGRITSWSYQWRCGCIATGFVSEPAAITAALSQHPLSEEQQGLSKGHIRIVSSA